MNQRDEEITGLKMEIVRLQTENDLLWSFVRAIDDYLLGTTPAQMLMMNSGGNADALMAGFSAFMFASLPTLAEAMRIRAELEPDSNPKKDELKPIIEDLARRYPKRGQSIGPDVAP